MGLSRPVELLPNGGILYMVAHDDGRICKWAEYSSVQLVGRPKKKIKGEAPTHIKCPRCKEEGRLNWAYDLSATKGERPFSFKYIVVHEPIPGFWGSGKRRRRCQSFTPTERIAILKQVGRYIADPPQLNHKQEDILKEKRLDRDIKQRIQTQTKTEFESASFRDQKKADAPESHNGPTYVPTGKRLTTCSGCTKPGYKYPTYFQHSNEPPIGPRMLKGKQEGWRYRRCSLGKEKVKHKDSTNRSASSTWEQARKVEPTYDSAIQGLDKYVQDVSSSQSKEDDEGKDYKKMYWDLVDILKKIVGASQNNSN